MHQKILYLNTLFDAVEKEQSNLLQCIKKTSHSFFEEIVQAEKDVRIGCGHVQDRKYSSSLKHFNHAFKSLQEYQSKTNLLDDLIISIRRERISSEYEFGNYDTVIEDAKILLEGNDNSTDGTDKTRSNIAKDEKSLNGRVKIMKVYVQALLKMGKVNEANEELGKLALLAPHDNDVTTLLNKLIL
jgi:tetratricopeptide (TPR) repeat protein